MTSHSPNPPEFPLSGPVRARQVMAFLGIQRIALWRWCKKGEFLPPRKLGHTLYWDAEQVRAFMKSPATKD